MSQTRLEVATTDYECWALAARELPTAVIAARLRTSQERVRQRINRCAGLDGMSELVLERRYRERARTATYFDRLRRRLEPPPAPRKRTALFTRKEAPHARA